MVTDITRKKVVRITFGTTPAEYAGIQMVSLLSASACLELIYQKIHPQGITCGNCGSDQSIGHGTTKGGFPRHRCKDCGFVYSVLSGTPFCGTKLNCRQLVLFMMMWKDERPAHEIARAVGLHRTSVWMLQQNLILHKKYNKAGEE